MHNIATDKKHIPYFKQKYLDNKQIIAEKLGVTNPHQIPKLKSVVLHTRYGQFLTDNNKKRFVREALSKIAGAIPREILARKSVAQFKAREGMLAGCMATLRGDNAYEFLTRLWIALPRSRNFNAFSPNLFDGRGNFNFGIPDHTAFIEVEGDLEHRFGFDVSIVTTAQDDRSAKCLLEHLGLPFKK